MNKVLNRVFLLLLLLTKKLTENAILTVPSSTYTERSEWLNTKMNVPHTESIYDLTNSLQKHTLDVL